jgi:CBS domain-containing protein
VTDMARVRDVMSTSLLTVEATMTLEEAAAQMHARRVGAALVLNGERLSGILTERDVLRAVATGGVGGTRVGAWMTHDPETIEPDDSTGHAAAVMIHGGFRHLPVLEGGRPVGIVSIRDLMRVTIDDEAPRGV